MSLDYFPTHYLSTFVSCRKLLHIEFGVGCQVLRHFDSSYSFCSKVFGLSPMQIYKKMLEEATILKKTLLETLYFKFLLDIKQTVKRNNLSDQSYKSSSKTQKNKGSKDSLLEFCEPFNIEPFVYYTQRQMNSSLFT